MSLQDRTSVRWLLPGIILAFVFASLAILIIRRNPVDSQLSVGAVQKAGIQNQEAPRLAGTNPLVISSVLTNQSEAEGGEERVVALVTEGNQLLTRGDYAEAAHKYE